MMIASKNPTLQENIAKHLVQIIKNVKPKNITVKQLEQATIHMKQNPKGESENISLSKPLWNDLWQENQKKTK
jgi:hypothetical protein